MQDPNVADAWRDYDSYLQSQRGVASSSHDVVLQRAIFNLRKKNEMVQGVEIMTVSSNCSKACHPYGESDITNGVFLCKRHNNIHVCTPGGKHPWTYVDGSCRVFCGSTKMQIGIEYENSRPEISKKRGCDPHRWFRGAPTKRNYEVDDGGAEDGELNEDACEPVEEEPLAEPKKLDFKKDIPKRAMHAEILRKPIQGKRARDVMEALSTEVEEEGAQPAADQRRTRDRSGKPEKRQRSPYIDEMLKWCSRVLDKLFNAKDMAKAQRDVADGKIQKEKATRSRYMHQCNREGKEHDTQYMQRFSANIKAFKDEPIITFEESQCERWMGVISKLWILLEPVFHELGEKMNKQFYERFVLGALAWIRIGLKIDTHELIYCDPAIGMFPCYPMLLKQAGYRPRKETSGSKLISDCVRELIHHQSMLSILQTLHPERFRFS